MTALRAALLAAAFLTGCGQGSVAWDDPAGDVKPLANAPQQPRLDIVRVEARGADGALRVKVRLKDRLEPHFAYRRPGGTSLAGVVAHFDLDTDNDQKTGGHLGYEYQVALQLGWRFGDGKASATATGDAFVDASKYKQAEPLAVFAIGRLKQGASSAEPAALPQGGREAAFKATSWKGDTVEAAIPYAWLGVKAGDTVRLRFYEPDGATAPDRGYSEDKAIKLGR